MSTTTSRASTQRRQADDASGRPNFLLEIGRHQMALVAEGTRALCRRSEAMRKIQQEAAHDASIFHAETGERLLSLRDPGELMNIQSELMRFALRSASNYWQQIIANAMNTQVEMMASIGHVLENEKEHGVKTPLEAFQSVIPPLASSFHVAHADEDGGKRLHS